MRRFTVAAALAAFVGTCGAASAADLSMKDSEYAPAPIWSGFYIGGHVGTVWNDDSTYGAMSRECHKVWDTKAETTSSACNQWKKMNAKFEDNKDDTKLIGGIQIGHNWQIGNRVFGLEADLSFADGLDYLGSLRARLGYARDNWLLYVTGGVAFAGFQNDDSKVAYG